MKRIVLLCLLFFIQGFCSPGYSAESGLGKDQEYILAQAVGQAPGNMEDEEDLFAEYDQTENLQEVADPLYYFNYAMYNLNDYLYFYALKPLAQGYKFVVPTPVRTGIGNFFQNLLFPVRFVNCLLQGKGSAAGDEFASFFVNSTVGILGFYDFAQKHMGLTPHTEDLGQTLATYHIGDGFYLVLPFFGPSTLRDSLGLAGDYLATPLNYAKPWELGWGLTGLYYVNKTSFRIGDYEALKKASLEPYVAIRNAYIQHRRAQIKE